MPKFPVDASKTKVIKVLKLLGLQPGGLINSKKRVTPLSLIKRKANESKSIVDLTISA